MIVCPECNATDARNSLPMAHTNRKAPNGYTVCDDCQNPPTRAECCEDGKRRLVLRTGLLPPQWNVERPLALYDVSHCPWCGRKLGEGRIE